MFSLCAAVLSTLSADGDFSYVTVIIGEPANFACTIVSGDTDFNIIWKIAGFEYFCDQHEVDPNIKCSVNSNTRVCSGQKTTIFLGLEITKSNVFCNQIFIKTTQMILPLYPSSEKTSQTQKLLNYCAVTVPLVSDMQGQLTGCFLLVYFHIAIETITTTVATSTVAGVTLVVCTTVMLILIIVLLKKRNRRRKEDHIFEGQVLYSMNLNYTISNLICKLQPRKQKHHTIGSCIISASKMQSLTHFPCTCRKSQFAKWNSMSRKLSYYSWVCWNYAEYSKIRM